MLDDIHIISVTLLFYLIKKDELIGMNSSFFLKLQPTTYFMGCKRIFNFLVENVSEEQPKLLPEFPVAFPV